MNRRQFILSSVALAAAPGLAAEAAASKPADTPQSAAPGKLIASAPVLQNHAEHTMGIAFALSALGNGFVDYSTAPDLAGAVRVKCGGYRVTGLSDIAAQVRLTGLKSATTYYYRIGADRIHYGGGYDMKILGTEIDPTIYSFTTAGADAESRFAVINDTHKRWQPFEAIVAKLAALKPPCVVWNGDATNTEETFAAVVEAYLTPRIASAGYAARTPFFFVPGNHDLRGRANRECERVWMFRDGAERAGRDWDLGRNFAVRQGDIALVGLDTAEDKLDSRDIFAGLFASERYREAQTEWLKDALARPEIKSAPFLVAFCHIPLFDADPTANPGDVNGNGGGKYKHDFAVWQRACARMWGPLLTAAGCQLVITAHQHRYRFDAPDTTRGWAQIVGGGTNLKPDAGNSAPTVIEGAVKDGRLVITVHNIATGVVSDTWTFAAR